MHSCDCRNEGAPPPVFFFGGGGVPSAPGAPRKVSVPPNLASSSLTLTVALALILNPDPNSTSLLWASSVMTNGGTLPQPLLPLLMPFSPR